MRKIVAVAAAAALCFSLTGCSQGESPEEPESTHQDQQQADNESSAQNAPSSVPESKEAPKATALKDSLRGLDYVVPAGWEARSSNETGKVYTSGRAILQVTAYDAPTSLDDQEDLVAQIALLASLSSWEDVALNGLNVDKELTKVNGLRMLGAHLELNQGGKVLEMHLATFQKGEAAFIVGVSAPATMSEEDMDAFSSLVASCK